MTGVPYADLCRAARSEPVERRNPVAAVDALDRVDRGAEVARPQRVAAAAVPLRGPPRPGPARARRSAARGRATTRRRSGDTSARNAHPLPAVPWQSPAPFASGPACQVSSPPARRSSPNSSSADRDPGERRDHPGRAVAPLHADRSPLLPSGLPATGVQFARSSSRDASAVAVATARRSSSARRPAASSPPSSESASTLPANPCPGPTYRTTSPYSRCVHRRGLGAPSATTARRRSRATRPPTAPRRSLPASPAPRASCPGSPTGARSSRCPSSRAPPARAVAPSPDRGRELVRGEQDPGLAQQESRHDARPVGLLQVASRAAARPSRSGRARAGGAPRRSPPAPR